MFLIMSAAYVEQELRAEFGKIPPAFLPLGNRRLFQHQLKLIPRGKEIFLSVPKSYKISKHDQELISNNNVTVLQIPDGLSLGESLIASIAQTPHSMSSSISILYGDTLLPIPEKNDVIAVSNTDMVYDWARVDEANGSIESAEALSFNLKNKIICGYFNFSSLSLLVKALSQTHWDFLAALNIYNTERSLSTEELRDWLDFGHINTYYASKADFTTQRSFNNLKINQNWIEKSSSHDLKIQAEANWFKSIPYELRHYTPQYLGDYNNDGVFSYRLEYLYQCALNELFVFAKLPSLTWKKIFHELSEFIEMCYKNEPELNENVDDFNDLFISKTKERLESYCLDRNISLVDTWSLNSEKPISLNSLIEISANNLPKNPKVSIMHGDFCFSNILYDFRKGKIKTIDPRGITTKGDLSIYGFVHYDIAKISHSVIGLYDWIIAGYYKVSINNFDIKFELPDAEDLSEIQSIFIDTIMKGYAISKVEIYAMQIQLFLSMLPLHSDDANRQDALFANAFRLYYKMLEEI